MMNQHPAQAAHFLTSSQTASHLGVAVSSVKRWADEGRLAYQLTDGGHRRFKIEDVKRFVAERTHQDFLSRDGINAWLDKLIPVPNIEAIRGQLLLERSRSSSWATPMTHLSQVFQEIGNLWSKGDLEIYEERLASGIVFALLSDFVSSIPVRPKSPRAMFATVEGDSHVLGLKMAELTMREAGWGTMWIGNLVPPDQLQSAMQANLFDCLVVSCTNGAPISMPLSAVQKFLEDACGEHQTRLVLGGSAPWDKSGPSDVLASFPTLEEWSTRVIREIRDQIDTAA